MKKTPPKSHLYTIIALLLLIGISGGIVAFSQLRSTDSPPAAQVPARSIPLTVSNDKDLGQVVSNQNIIKLQEGATNLQSAAGAQIYANFDPGQNTKTPRDTN